MLVKRRLDELHPLSSNPRRRVDAGFRALVDSISTPEFGVDDGAPCSLQPVVVNTHPDHAGTIIGGHRRWEAAREAGFEEVWTREASLDAEKMAELATRFNVPAGEWDWELLIPFGGQQLVEWGFFDLELPALPPAEGVELRLEDFPAAAPGGGNGDGAAPSFPSGEVGGDPGDGVQAGTPYPGLDPDGMNRQFQVFLMGGEFQELYALLERFKEHFELKTQSDTLMAMARYAAEQLDAEEEA